MKPFNGFMNYWMGTLLVIIMVSCLLLTYTGWIDNKEWKNVGGWNTNEIAEGFQGFDEQTKMISCSNNCRDKWAHLFTLGKPDTGITKGLTVAFYPSSADINSFYRLYSIYNDDGTSNVAMFKSQNISESVNGISGAKVVYDSSSKIYKLYIKVASDTFKNVAVKFLVTNPNPEVDRNEMESELTMSAEDPSSTAALAVPRLEMDSGNIAGNIPADIPRTNTSGLTNYYTKTESDGKYLTKDVNNLTNYYNKNASDARFAKIDDLTNTVSGLSSRVTSIDNTRVALPDGGEFRVNSANNTALFKVSSPSGNISTPGSVSSASLTTGNINSSGTLNVNGKSTLKDVDVNGNTNFTNGKITFNDASDFAQIGLEGTEANRRDLVVRWGDDANDNVRFVYKQWNANDKNVMTLKSNGVDVNGTITASDRATFNNGLNVRNSLNTQMLRFMIGGDISRYYPVAIEVGPWIDNSLGRYSIEIVRKNVHLDSEWRGSMNLVIEGVLNNWGHGSNHMKYEFNQNRKRFIGGIRESDKYNVVIVWLLGGNTTYHYKINNGGWIHNIDALKAPAANYEWVVGSGEHIEKYATFTVPTDGFDRDNGRFDGHPGRQTIRSEVVMQNGLSVRDNWIRAGPSLTKTPVWSGGVHAWDIYTEATIGLGKDGNVVSSLNSGGDASFGRNLNVNGNTTMNSAQVRGNNTLEFGAGIAGKEVNAGKIGYQTFGTNNGLEIFGAGSASNNRKIRFYNEGGANFTGPITTPEIGTENYIFVDAYDASQISGALKNIGRNNSTVTTRSAGNLQRPGCPRMDNWAAICPPGTYQVGMSNSCNQFYPICKKLN